MKYRVELERITRETAIVVVEADNIEAAKDVAHGMAKDGDVVWEGDVTAIETRGAWNAEDLRK